MAIAVAIGDAALHDLDVERHREIERRLQRDDGEHARRPRRAPAANRSLRARAAASCPPPGVGASTSGRPGRARCPPRSRSARGTGRAGRTARSGVASARPQRFRLLKPKLMRMMAAAARTTPTKSICTSGRAVVGLEAEAQQKDDGRDGDQNSERRTPADEGAEDAADDERQHAGAGARRTQRAHRRRLLASVVVLGDERHQRRHDHGAGRAAEGLRRDHQGRGRAECHQHLRGAEQDDGGAEHARRAVALGRASRRA